MRIGSFTDQLNERRVYRAAALYVVAMFALWQAADIAIPALGLPQALMRYVVAGAILGFPVVVVLSWVYDLRIESAGPVNTKTRYAIGLGILAVLVVSVSLMLIRHERSEVPVVVGGVSFEMGVEEFFSGNLDRAVAIFSAVASDRSDPDGNLRDALRYLVRAYSLSGHRDKAQEAVRELLALEPPIALMAPSVESDAVMAIYYDVRRASLDATIHADTQPPVQAIEILPFVDRSAGSPDVDGEDGSSSARDRTGLGEGIAGALLAELVQRTEGIQFVDRSGVGAEHGFAVYRYLDSPSADQIVKPTHLAFGSVAGQTDSQMLISVWVFEASSGRLTHSSQVVGAWQDPWALLLRLADDLSAKLRH